MFPFPGNNSVDKRFNSFLTEVLIIGLIFDTNIL